MNFSSSVDSYIRKHYRYIHPLHAYLEVLLIQERNVPLEGLCLPLQFILVFNELSVDMLEMFDLPLQGHELIFSRSQGDFTVIFDVDQLFTSKEFLVIHLSQRVLSLHVLVVEGLEVLDFCIQLLKSGLDLIYLVMFLAKLHMHICQISIDLLASLIQMRDPSLILIKFALKLLYSQSVASDIQIPRRNCLLKPLNLLIALVRDSCCLSKLSLQTLYLALLRVVPALHHSHLCSQLSVLLVLLCEDPVCLLNVH